MTSRRAGRPRGPLRGDSAEANELARLLQGLLKDRGMTLRQLRDSFTDEQFAPQPVPSYATVARRLNGEGLVDQTSLITAIISACVPSDEVARVQKHAFHLMRKAKLSPTPVQVPSEEVDASAGLREEISRLRGRLIALQDELAVERRLRVDAEKKAAQNISAISWLLTSHRPAAPRSEAPHPQVSSPPVTVRRPEPEESTLVSTPSTSSSDGPDSELEALFDALSPLDPTGQRFAAVLRRVWDQQLDGAHTGRYRWDQLQKTEKAFMNTLVRQSVLREFGFSEGATLEFMLAGIEFDCKFSIRAGRWQIPRDAVGKLCMLIWADDRQTRWGVGIVRLHRHFLHAAANRDHKTALNDEGRAAIRWLHQDASLPANVLLHLPEDEVTAIFGLRSGQARVEELFRRAQRQLISAPSVATVAIQADAAKRVRTARRQLSAEGIVVLGSAAVDQRMALELGLQVPAKAEWISARLAPRDASYDETPFIEVGQQRWTLAEPEDPNPGVGLPRFPRQPSRFEAATSVANHWRYY